MSLSLINNLDQILEEAIGIINNTQDLHAIEQIRSQYLGKKGKLTDVLKTLGTLEPKYRPKAGQAINLAKNRLIVAIEVRRQVLQVNELEKNLAQETVDITLPPRGQTPGTLHPVTRVQKLFENFFLSMGFSVVEGPEIETEFYNFTALNIPPHHPARAIHDTFYFESGMMLRTQTSPVQIRAMQKMQPPIRIVCPGRVFRCDNDATHAPMFHQMEMLIVDENVNLANLKWIISKFIEYFFKEKIEYRFRPSYFPFTSLSAEVDLKWEVGGAWRWLELGGCGVVHPNVLRAGGIDPDRFQGLAFGFGIDRLAMVYYGIKDIRMLFENDVQFLQQF
ncbi:phenylalanine--tRNA ligase subunit alpha [Gammaproteobacteria bacterium]